MKMNEFVMWVFLGSGYRGTKNCPSPILSLVRPNLKACFPRKPAKKTSQKIELERNAKLVTPNYPLKKLRPEYLNKIIIPLFEASFPPPCSPNLRFSSAFC